MPEEYRNGIITRYTIHYKDVAKDTESTVDILAPASVKTITGLRQKTLYSIRILAATSKGDGQLSSANETKTLGKSDIKCGLVITKSECSIFTYVQKCTR